MVVPSHLALRSADAFLRLIPEVFMFAAFGHAVLGILATTPGLIAWSAMFGVMYVVGWAVLRRRAEFPYSPLLRLLCAAMLVVVLLDGALNLLSAILLAFPLVGLPAVSMPGLVPQ